MTWSKEGTDVLTTISKTPWRDWGWVIQDLGYKRKVVSFITTNPVLITDLDSQLTDKTFN